MQRFAHRDIQTARLGFTLNITDEVLVPPSSRGITLRVCLSFENMFGEVKKKQVRTTVKVTSRICVNNVSLVYFMLHS